MKILLLRTHYAKSYTQGIMLIEDKFFGYTLEDALRFTPKEPAKTCIPAGFYKVKVNYSRRFKKLMPLIQHVPGFLGIRIHGGNTPENTSGCPLVAKNRSEGKIWGSLGPWLTELLQRSDEVHWIEIVNTREI